MVLPKTKEELLETIERVAPSYMAAARKAGLTEDEILLDWDEPVNLGWSDTTRRVIG